MTYQVAFVKISSEYFPPPHQLFYKREPFFVLEEILEVSKNEYIQCIQSMTLRLNLLSCDMPLTVSILPSHIVVINTPSLPKV